MKMKRKEDIVWIAVGFLALVFVGLSFFINDQMDIQNQISNDLSEVEYLSSSTQRLALMVVTENIDNRVVFYIDEQTSKYLSTSSSDKLSILDHPEIQEVSVDILNNWENLYQLFQSPSEVVEEGDSAYDADAILLASENHFNSMTNLSMLIAEEVGSMSDSIHRLHLYSYCILLMGVLILLNHFVATSMALKRSNELADIASLDIATGLFNRSKCQELFKDGSATKREQQPAVVVIDLNDLKKTNDLLGHRTGDELISCFATLLKEAVNVHNVRPFLGRYGGDEFVIYYKDVEKEDEIAGFLKELAFLTTEFNKKENFKFTVSYAAGYAVKTDSSVEMTTRQLFDKADENMYINKKMIKKAQMDVSAEQQNI
ncbi:MAG: GGDEF domain-containing protein [Eubacteriales bacterium]